MKMDKNKTAILIALFLAFTIAASVVTLPTVDAQTVRTINSEIYVTAQPIAAIGQPMFLIYWTQSMPPDIGEQMGEVDSPSGRAGWYDITLTVTHPDGTEEVFDMPYSDPVGGGYLSYTPTEVGNYSVRANFPGTWKNSTYSHTWYPPAESREDPFTVREEPIAGWPEPPLPTDYWNRPVSGTSHAWSAVLGNWYGSYAKRYPLGAYGGDSYPYAWGDAPESAHILWTRQHYPSGSLLDERFGPEVNTLNHYQDVDFDGMDLILDGVIHYTYQYSGHWGAGNPVDNYGWGGLSLYTGEQLFLDKDVMKPAFGQIFVYNSPNQHGGFSYLWRTSGVEVPDYVIRDPRYGPDENVTDLHSRPGTETWEMLDAYTGNRICYVFNVSDSGTMVNSKIGAITIYDTENLGTSSSPNYYLTIWNSSEPISMYAGDYGTYRWQWRPGYGGHSNYGYQWRENTEAFHDGDTAFSLNVSIPSIRGPINSRSNQTASIRAIREGEYIIFGTTGINDPDGVAPCWLMCLSLEPGKEGQKLWETTFTPPVAETQGAQFTAGMSLVQTSPENEVIVFNNRVVQKYWVYDMKTGERLWVSDAEPQLHYYSMNNMVYNDTLITYGRAGGVLTCYDIRTGEIRWKYIAEGEGTESPYGNAVIQGCVISDGKVYMGSSEHSASSPLWRTPGLRCVDATTGEEIWKILFWGSDLAIADGILVSWNWYDGQIYAFGKGPSATTVSASPKTTTHGTAVVIEGTVTDQTPTGRRNINNEVQFTLEGTPAISDEDMEAWMEYKFMEQGFPADAKGVEVVLTVVDPNSNAYEIGRATSDVTGHYSLSYEPLVPGDYTIFAAFEGSASYYGSQAVTAITVEEAPAATPMPTPPPASVADMYLLPSVAGIIVAVVVIGILIILMLRKR
jgi:hypothetical protein